MLTLTTLTGKAFENISRKVKFSFFPFPATFFTKSKTNLVIWATFNLSSANAFNLDQTNILLSGKGFMYTVYIETRQNKNRLANIFQLHTHKQYKNIYYYKKIQHAQLLIIQFLENIVRGKGENTDNWN